MNKHKHMFTHAGGGCYMKPEDISKACDNSYECSCGERFVVYTSPTGHRFMPDSFETGQISEIRSEEHKIQDDIFLGNLNNEHE